jgi:Uma2 family endonuclease
LGARRRRRALAATTAKGHDGTVTVLPRGRALTRRDLATMPDDGHRYELIDGTLVVTPAPSMQHQATLARLHMRLVARCPSEMRVLFAPPDVALAEDTVLQPDLLVAGLPDSPTADLPAVPLLAVEVLAPSTRRLDLTLKRDRYEAAGCPSYWTVDPEEPAVTVWQLEDGRYVEVAHVVGPEQFNVDAPYPMTVCPAELVD